MPRRCSNVALRSKSTHLRSCWATSSCAPKGGNEVMTMEQWHAEGERLFDPDEMQGQFVCPACGHVASPADWKAAGAKESHVAFSCVGRFLHDSRDAFAKGPGPCNYAGG